MQRSRAGAFTGLLFSLLSVASAFGQGAPPQVLIETVYPRHVIQGQTTVINVAVPSRDVVQSVEIAPADGVTVTAVKGNSSETEQAIGWWEIALDVARDAVPGDRSLVLVMRMGRTAPVRISVSTHMPSISDLRIMPPASTQSTTDLQLTAADAAGDLGDSVYVWFTAGCGGEPIVGAIRGKVSGGVVRAALPNLRTLPRVGVEAAGPCTMEVRISDSGGVESNTLKTTVEFRN